MSTARPAPLSFPDAEPWAAPKNDLPAQALSAIVPGTRMFEELTEMASTGLPALSERTALMVSGIYACTNLISGAVGTLTLDIFSRPKPKAEFEKNPDDDLWWVLNEEMTPRWAAPVGWEFVMRSLLLKGNGYLKITRNPLGQPVGLEPIHPDRVWPLVTPDGKRLVYVVAPDPLIMQPAQVGVQVLDQDDMMHIPGFGFDGRVGLSPISYALRFPGAVAFAAQEYAGRFFANGARPDYALQTEQTLGPEKIEELAERLERRHRGPANVHKPIVLTNGLKIEQITLDAEEIQLLETRQFQIEEIARIYGVPPFMIGHNEKTTSWGSGVESMGKAFVRYALRQHLNKIAVEVRRKLFRTAARTARHDVTELEKADFKTLMEALRMGVGQPGAPGFITPNQAASTAGFKTNTGGDALFTGQAINAPPAAPAQK